MVSLYLCVFLMADATSVCVGWAKGNYLPAIIGTITLRLYLFTKVHFFVM